MSKILKGFVEIEALQSAAPNVISPIGEMSTWAMTYTKDKNEFTDPSVAGYRLVATNYVDNLTGPEIPTSAIIEEVIDVVRRIMVYATTNQLPYNLDDFHNSLIADLFNSVSNLRFGPLRTNGYIQIFDWVEWESVTTPGTRVKIWLSDAAFASQYDLFDIVVVPPIPVIDDFFLIPNAVRNKISAITPSQMMESIQAAKNRNPETYIRSEVFNYHSPILSDPQTPTTWNVLIYGYQGDNIDSIKDAIVAYILANTTHTEAEWKVIFPEIFKRTEFVFLPRWDLISIPNLTVQAGMYRSILNPHEAVAYAKANVSFYTQEWIDQHIEILPFDYKAIMLEVITGSNNIEGVDSLQVVFPDYLPVSTSSPDFNRMTQATQEWILILEQLLIVAENLDSYTTVPEDVHVVTRDNVKYVSAYYDNVNYLVQQRVIAP